MIVRVERIRKGRRLPEVEHVEAPPPRRWHGYKLQGGGDGGNAPDVHPKRPRSALRLPWQTKKDRV